MELQRLTFDERGIRIENSVVRVDWPWTRLRDLSNEGGFLILRIDSVSGGAVIPKSALSEEQCSALLSYAKGVS